MTKLTHRFTARLVLEADTALFVGSGESSLLKDALVVTDANGWPIVPGTSITGVLRNSLSKVLDGKVLNDIFGFQKSDEGSGSRLLVSHGHMMLTESKVAEGLMAEDYAAILAKFEDLPSRQRVRISSQGAAVKGGLFDNEVVYKGTRFMVELELKGTKEDKSHWDNIIKAISNPLFRIGSGTRNGYGSMKVIAQKSFQRVYDLTNKDELDKYLNHPAYFNTPVSESSSLASDTSNEKGSITYTLELKPDDFFIFSEGYGDQDVHNKPVTEEVLIYNDSGFTFEKYTLIPGSSMKGAIAHRTAFHYNKLKGRFADELIPNITYKVAENLYSGSGNKAVNELFGLGNGFDWEEDTNEAIKNGYNYYENYGDAHRGHVIIDDIYLNEDEVDNEKIFNHVAIDRFTGGAMDTALFSEKVSHLKEGKESITLKIHLDNPNLDAMCVQALENALLDITKGLLPLGGMTTKGFGMFTGSLTKSAPNNQNEVITKYHQKESKQ